MTYIKTTYENEKELIESILELYNDKSGVDLDPCYSVGRFWNGLPKPKLKFDLEPQTEDTEKSSCNSLPLENCSVKSIMFDPPFVIGQGKSTNGIMRKRFSAFYKLQDLKDLYSSSLSEFLRILDKKGVVIFKCQDTVTGGKQFMTHVWVINEAEKLGYLIEDLFILVRKKAIVDPKWKKQYHARKTHSYYIVLRKK